MSNLDLLRGQIVKSTKKAELFKATSFSDFQLLAFNDRWVGGLSKGLASLLVEFVQITGPYCAGKSTLVKALCRRHPGRFRQMPEAMDVSCRPIREGESYAQDLFPLESWQFDEALENGEFFIAYEFGEGGRRKRAGILIGTVLDALVSLQTKIIIMNPYAGILFRQVFPLTRCIRVVPGNRSDYKKFQRSRGCFAGNEQNLEGVKDDCRIYMPDPILTETFFNSANSITFVREVERIAQWIETPRVY